MIHGKKLVVVLPAYNAEPTLERTLADLPPDLVDEVLTGERERGLSSGDGLRNP